MANWSGTFSITAGGTGTSTGGNTSTTFANTGATWPTGAQSLANFTVRILTGLGAGQERIITSNTATVLTVPTWTTTPDNTSTYEIVLVFKNNDHITSNLILSTSIITEIEDSATLLVDGNYSVTFQNSCTVRWNKNSNTLCTICANNRTVQGRSGFWNSLILANTLSVLPYITYIKIMDCVNAVVANPSSGLGDCSTINHLWVSCSSSRSIYYSTAVPTTNMTINNIYVENSGVCNFEFGNTSSNVYSQIYNYLWSENAYTPIVWRTGACATQSINNSVFLTSLTANLAPPATGQIYNTQDSYINLVASDNQSPLFNVPSMTGGTAQFSRNSVYGTRMFFANASSTGIAQSKFNDISSRILVSRKYMDFTGATAATYTSDNDYISGQNAACQDNIDTTNLTNSTANPSQYGTLTTARTNAKSVRNKPFVCDNVSVGTPSSSSVVITFDNENGAVSGQGSSTVNVDSNSGTSTLNIVDSTGFEVGETIEIGYGTARYETAVVATIPGATSLTITTNLVYTHTAAQADTVKKRLRNIALPYIQYGTSSGNYTMQSELPPMSNWGLIYTGIQPSYNGNNYSFNYIGHSVTLNNLKPGTTYYFVACARNPLNDTLISSEGSFTTPGVTVGFTFS